MEGSTDLTVDRTGRNRRTDGVLLALYLIYTIPQFSKCTKTSVGVPLGQDDLANSLVIPFEEDENDSKMWFFWTIIISRACMR